MSRSPAQNSPALLAALYLEAVLPAIPLLATRDAALAAALAGSDFAVVFTTAGHLRTRLALRAGVATGSFGAASSPQPGDIRLWFPSPGQVVRAFDGRRRPAIALPLGGWLRLFRLRRLSAAGQRVEFILTHRPPPADTAALALHAWGNLAVGLAAATAWLRHHPDGPAARARLGSGVVVFSCPALPSSLWLDLTSLTTGAGEPPHGAVLMATVTFADLDTLLAELDHQLDAPAALGLGTLRLSGHLPLAENLSLLLLKVGNLLKTNTR
jgi:hypothetical protein